MHIGKLSKYCRCALILRAGDTVENGYALWADSYDNQSDADRAAHKAVPVQVALVLAGSIESIVITVNVMV